MKRILCIALASMLIFSFAGCKSTKKTGTGVVGGTDGLNIDAAETVNKAYAATDKALNSANDLGFKTEVTLTVTVEDQTVKSVAGTEFRFIKGDALKVYNKTTVKSDAVNSELDIYTDGVNVYGATAGASYKITAGYETNKYFSDLVKTVTVYDASGITPINTKLVSVSGGGYGFVALYPIDGVPSDFEEIIGAQLTKFKNVTAKQLKVSGLIDAEGRLQSQTVTYDFAYEYTVEADDIDPDNSDSSGSVTVTKVAIASLSIAFEYNYDVTEVKQGGNIVLPSADGEALKEMSLSDFQMLAALTGAVDSSESPDR